MIPDREEGSRWSIKREDLSEDWALKDCPMMEFEGRQCRSLGRVALLSRIGKGGMGVVYFGVNPRLESEVAVKVLPRALLEHQDGLVERFLQEARLAARLRSDHLVSVLDVDEDPHSGCHYIVMEYVNGFSASVWRIQNAPNPTEADALDICIAGSKGLAAAHKEGVIHRDIKPANILIPYEKGRALCSKAKLADLGLARSDTSEGSLTGTQHTMGTPGYLAPEQAVDAKRAHKPADVFGMAASLYALLCGKAPFAGESASDALVRTALGRYQDPREIRPDVSHITAALIEKCLRPDQKKRFPDAAALLNALTICRANLDSDSATRLPELSLLAGKPLTKTMVPMEATRTVRKPAGKTQLSITSTPPGATVEVKGAARGKTPLIVTGLDRGAHRVKLTLEYHRPWETSDAIAKTGQKTELHANLERDAGTITVAGGAPGAKLTLTLVDFPDKSLALDLDENGVIVGETIPAGHYAVSATHPGFAAFEGEVIVPGKGIASLQLRMDEREGMLTLDSVPTGAAVRVDGESVGRAPVTGLVLAPGPHEVELRMQHYEVESLTCDVRGAETTDLGLIDLSPCGVIEVSGLPSDIVATVSGHRLLDDTPMPRGKHLVRLARTGYLPQVVCVEVETGQSSPVEPAEWEASILADLAGWDAADSDARLAAAMRVAERTDGVLFKGLSVFEAGGQSREVALFHHARSGLEFSLVPSGTFQQGSADDARGRNRDEGLHTVSLTQPFLVCRTVVTQQVWESVMGGNPSVLKDPTRPVERVSWHEARQFCAATALELPTEAQWEYACRAGTTTRFCHGDDDASLGEYAWIEKNSDRKHQPVGQKLPNAFGLHDVHGNVWEWCEDGYGPYPEGDVSDPVGTPDSDARVMRGGSFSFSAHFARSAFRRKAPPESRFIAVGFRPVKRLEIE